MTGALEYRHVAVLPSVIASESALGGVRWAGPGVRLRYGVPEESGHEGECRCQLIHAEFRISERVASPRPGLDSCLAQRRVWMTDSPTTTAATEP